MLCVTDYMFRKGFTLTELILVVAIILILALMTPPIYNSFTLRSDLQTVVSSGAQSLRRAQILSQAVMGDESWGVRFQTSTVVIFRGLSFILRDPSFDETINFSSELSVTGTLEFVFEKFSGRALSLGTTTFTNLSGESSTLEVNSKGTVFY